MLTVILESIVIYKLDIDIDIGDCLWLVKFASIFQGSGVRVRGLDARRDDQMTSYSHFKVQSD